MSRSVPSSNGLPLQNSANVVYCRYPIEDGHVDSLRAALARTLQAEAKPERAVGVGLEGRRWEPYTVSIFLELFGERSFLVWHVEGNWDTADPAVLVEEMPLFEALESFVETDDKTVIEPSVFARSPTRPSSPSRRMDGIPFVLGSVDSGTAPPDVVLFRPGIRPGLPTKAITWFQALIDRFEDDGWIERKFDEWTEPVIDEEGVYTETAFLEWIDGDCYYVNYLECESRERVWEAYHESRNAVARVSEWVLRWTLEDQSFLEPVPETSGELLVHAVNDRRS